METKVQEIPDGNYRLSTFVPEIAPPAGFTFNQFLVLGETPYCSTRVRRKFQRIRSAFVDGAIEALEEGKPETEGPEHDRIPSG